MAIPSGLRLTGAKKFFVKHRKFIFWIFPVALIGVFYWVILRDLPSPAKLGRYDVPLATKIYDRKGELLFDIFADQNRSPVPLSDIPKIVRDATIAIEDKTFYQHSGINPIGGVVRALYASVLNKKLQGGSTITQQLVKSALLTPERTVTRKLKEFLLAPTVELLYSKDKILEMYLNTVPYGGTAWGIETAAEKYFGVSIKDVTLAQAAILAGLPQAPTLYSPFGAHPELAKERQKEVLRRMTEDGYITKVLVERGGLKVTTTLDLELQNYTQATVAAEVAKLKNLRVGNGAAIVTKPSTGEILAMVGSIDYFATPSGSFNVTTALRQPGSSIKPINYAIGIENKIVTPATTFLDVPTCFIGSPGQPIYCPRNYDGTFRGPVQLRFALGNSLNIPAVKMLYLNTVQGMVASASAFGLDTLTDPSKYGLSLTLGGGEVRMTDMAEAFSVFANAGIRHDLVSILKVVDKNGKVLEENKDPNIAKDIPSQLLLTGQRTVSPETAFLISHMLLDNNARQQAFGPNSALVIPNRAVSVKTGTTNDLRDNWTIGYTPQFLVAAWVGNNDNSPMNPYLTSGVTGAAPIWNKIMRRVLEGKPDIWPKQPDGITGGRVCTTNGLLPPNTSGTPNQQDSAGSQPDEALGCPTRYEYFIKGTVARSTSSRQIVPIDKTTGDLAAPGITENIEMQEHDIAWDGVTRWCLDCTHPEGKAVIVK
ncbi:transglycosylase domain-containing protein [Candidatus Gottesmanbacteria bacterium]|nr:transglycosylase domain-containing protein [Candidatus Gottesmanbacteria bacterium]